MDFAVLERAGISQAQFASLLGVTRVTVNTWVRGRFGPTRALRQKTRFALRLLQEAVDAGTLPVKVDARAATEQALRPISERVAAAEA